YVSIMLLPLMIFQGLGSIVKATFQITNQYAKLSSYLMIKNSILMTSTLILFVFTFNYFIFLYGLFSLLALIYSIFVIYNFNNDLFVGTQDSTQPKVISIFKFAWPFGAQ